MRIRKISETLRMRVYTDNGDYFGEIEEATLKENKIDGWRIKVHGSMMSIISGARGVIIPHQFVKAISDVFIISKSALPSGPSPEEISEDL